MSENEKDAYTYKYFILGNVRPIRVAFNDKGHKVGAQVPNEATQDLEWDTELLSRLEKSHEVEEINQEKFETMCADILSKKNTRSLNISLNM